MSFDISTLTGFTVEDAGRFFSKAVLGAKVSQMMVKVIGIKSAIKLPTLDMGYDILQSDTDCTFDDGQNDLIIAQRTLTPVDIKINEKYCVKELEPFFTQKILPPGGDYQTVPPELRLFDIVAERVQKVIELAVVRGILGGASAIASFNLFDGMLETVSNDIAAGDIPAAQQTSLDLTPTDIIASFRAMYDALPADNFNATVGDGDWVIYCSPQSKATYDRAYQAAFGLHQNGVGFDKNFLDTTGIEIVSLDGFREDTSQAILTRKSNWWMGVDIDGEETELTLELGAGSEARDLFLTALFKMGIQDKFPSEMVVNNIS